MCGIVLQKSFFKKGVSNMSTDKIGSEAHYTGEVHFPCQASGISITKPTNSYNSKVAGMHGMKNSHGISTRDVNANNLSVFSIDVSKTDRQKISKMLADNIDSTAEKFLNAEGKTLRFKITSVYQKQLKALKGVIDNIKI